MIHEDALAYKRGDLVEFKLHLGTGTKRCRGLVLNTAVSFGRAARQVWIVEIDDAAPDVAERWTNKKFIVGEQEIISLIPSVLIGRDTLLRDNPICYPIQNGNELKEIPAAIISVPIPAPVPVATRDEQGDAQELQRPTNSQQ